MRCRRLSSLTACLCTSSGMPASSIAFFSSSISAAVSSPSPSSFWIWRICSRSTCSRWRSSNCFLVFSPISLEMRSTPTRSDEQLEHLVEAPLQVEGLEQLLLLLVLHVEEVRRPCRRAAPARSRPAPPPRAPRARSAGAGSPRPPAASAGGSAPRFRARCSRPALDHLDARDHERPALEEFEHAEARLALHHEVVRALRRR